MDGFTKVTLFLSLMGMVLLVIGQDANVEIEEHDTDASVVDDTSLTYAKGSLCGYCDYCKVRCT